MKRLAVLALLSSALVSPLAQSAEIPTVGRSSVVEATGNAGIVVSVESAFPLSARNMTIAREGGTMAWVGIAPAPGNPIACSDASRLGSACVLWQLYDVGWTRTTVSAPDPDEITPGLWQIFVLTDGSVSVRFDTTVAPGAPIHATGAVEGTIERLPLRCIDPIDCSTLAYAGSTHRAGMTNGAPGFVSVAAYVTYDPISTGTPPGDAAIDGCMYPSYDQPDVSSGAEDHQLGCDVLSGATVGDAVAAANAAAFFAESAALASQGRFVVRSWGGAHGDEYLGFRGHQVVIASTGRMGAVGIWLTAEIDSA
jgi:hypothetical protein